MMNQHGVLALKEITDLLFRHIESVYPAQRPLAEQPQLKPSRKKPAPLLPIESLQLQKFYELPSGHQEIPAEAPLSAKQVVKKKPTSSLTPTTTPHSKPKAPAPSASPVISTPERKEAISTPLAAPSAEKKRDSRQSFETGHDKEREEEIAAISLGISEGDTAVYEKKKRSALFPRPRTSPIKEDYYTPAHLKKISSVTGKPLHSSILYPHTENESAASNKWKIVSLFHPNSANKELPVFLQSIIDAIESKLGIETGKAALFHEIKKNPISELSLGDFSFTFIAGEPHQLSHFESYISDLPYFIPEVKSGFAPCHSLGKYFDARLLFLPIDSGFIHNSSAKQELWRLMKHLALKAKGT